MSVVNHSHRELTQLLLSACRRAREVILSQLGNREAWTVVGRGAGGDETLLIDRLAEEAIVEQLKQEGIEFVLISEEAGRTSFGPSPSVYVIADPLDGTHNARTGIPFFAVSLAAAEKPMLSSVVAAAVVDVVGGEEFYAAKGEGAYLDGERLVSPRKRELFEATIGVSVSRSPRAVESLRRVLSRARNVRQLGANALEMCYVAAGRLDAFMDLRNRIRAIDVAAGCLIIREAGGVIALANPEVALREIDPQLRLSYVAATNKGLLEEILELIEGFSKSSSP